MWKQLGWTHSALPVVHACEGVAVGVAQAVLASSGRGGAGEEERWAGGQSLLSPGVRGGHLACALVVDWRKGAPSLRSTLPGFQLSLPCSGVSFGGIQARLSASAVPRPLSVLCTGCCCFCQTLQSAGGAFRPPSVLATPDLVSASQGMFWPATRQSHVVYP